MSSDNDAARATGRTGNTWAWDQYWRDGRLASCGGEGGANYQPAITEGWRRFFATLDDGSRVLDVCAGNGAIARLAAELARERGIRVSIDATDSALIAGAGPEADSTAEHGMIRFHSRVPAESLPFPSRCFDVVVGQYALEYTDLERSLPELARVSKDNARIRFVLHAASGVVAVSAARQLEDIMRLRASGIFEAAEALANARAERSGQAQRNAAEEQFRGALQALQHAAREAFDDSMHRNIGGVLVYALQQQARVGPKPVLNKIAEAADTVGAHAVRLAAMSEAALDEEGASVLARRASGAWRRPMGVTTVTREDGALFGWILAPTIDSGERPAREG